MAQKRPQKITGLRYWMLRVLEECDRAAQGFEADPVHDLRVALRRCRSMADGIRALDPNRDWKAMKKAGRGLFQNLGALRDVQIMMEWVETLQLDAEGQALATTEATDAAESSGVEQKENSASASQSLLRILSLREKEHKLEAQAALEGFDRKQWRQWSKTLPARAARHRPGSALFKHIALERWTEARKLHSLALRNRSQTALHTLRIGIKRFRYIVENFLPAEHKAWSADLKEVQDLLGEVHDLDVLWATAQSCHVFLDAESRQRWHKQIIAERTRRVEAYRAKMTGPDSLWDVWRAGLPQGRQVQALATRRMKVWAAALDTDFAHSERVAGFAVQLFDGLLADGWQPAIDAAAARSSLLAAALLHDVGKTKGDKGHHKASAELIREHGNPLGWSAADLERAAVVARFHRGRLPSRKHWSLRDLLPGEQKAIVQLAAVLRLANAFDAAHDGRILQVLVGDKSTERGQNRSDGLHRHASSDQPLIISAEGYSAFMPSAQAIAAERHLLETVVRRPVLVKPLHRKTK